MTDSISNMSATHISTGNSNIWMGLRATWPYLLTTSLLILLTTDIPKYASSPRNFLLVSFVDNQTVKANSGATTNLDNQEMKPRVSYYSQSLRTIHDVMTKNESVHKSSIRRGKEMGMGMRIQMIREERGDGTVPFFLRVHDVYTNKTTKIQMHPKVNHCSPMSVSHAPISDDAINNTMSTPTRYVRYEQNIDTDSVFIGCSLVDNKLFLKQPVPNSRHTSCGQQCSNQNYKYYAQNAYSDHCWCGNELPTLPPYPAQCDQKSECNYSRPAYKNITCFDSKFTSHYRIGPWPPHVTMNRIGLPSWWGNQPKVITIFLWANPRLASIFRTCRMANMSVRFDYEVFDMRHQVRNANKEHVSALLKEFSGPKIIVFDGCCVPAWMLMNWPSNTVLIIASDESARWGFGNIRQLYGTLSM